MKVSQYCRFTWIPLLLVSAGLLRAHEPYLLLTANPDGTFTAETGFSDHASVEGLKLIVRDRNTTEVLSEHPLPAGGKLTLTTPPVPYRVTFDAGPGHRISKPGPERETPVVAPVSTLPSRTPAPPPVEPAKTSTLPPHPHLPATLPANVSAGTDTIHGGSDMIRIMLVVGIFFSFGAVAFALGYGAGRRRG